MDELQRTFAKIDRQLKRYDKHREADRRAHPGLYPPSGNTKPMAPLAGCNCVSCWAFRAGGMSDIGPEI